MSLNILWVLLVTSIILYFLKRRNASSIILIISLIWFAAISFPFVPYFFLRNLEDQYPSLANIQDLRDKKDIHIVLLGGGRGESRLVEGFRLYRMLPESFLVFTGRSNAKRLKKYAMTLGVEESKIKLVPEARNTKEEARDYLELFGTGSHVILVTDAAHMPRAMYLFKSMGIDPVPAPTNHMIQSERIEDWSPSFRNIEIMDYYLHEKIGLMWAKLKSKNVER